MRDVVGRTAFVTGGASGIGLAMARSFAKAGVKVAIADVEAPALERAAAALREITPEVLPLSIDITDRDHMARAAEATAQRFGKIHVLCNNAGVSVAGPIDRMQYTDWDWVMGVNLQGAINGTQAFLPHILAHGEGGHIVNTASIAGLVAQPGVSIYSCSKYAIVALSEAMRGDLAGKQVGVSVLCPHAVATGIAESQRNRPAQLARATPGMPRPPNPALAEAIRQLFASALDPALVGDIALEAIRNDEFWIFSHPAQRVDVQARHDEILAAFDRWEQYCASLAG